MAIRQVIGLLVASGVMCLAVYGARRLVRRNAPFYSRLNIVIVGITIGVVAALLVYGWNRYLDISGWARLLVLFVTLAAIVGIAFKPDKIDWNNKTRQTTVFAVFSYLATGLAIYFSV